MSKDSGDRREKHRKPNRRMVMTGVSSIFDLGGINTHKSYKKNRTRKSGVGSDWAAVGDDLRKFMS